MKWTVFIVLCVAVLIHGDEEWKEVKTRQGPVRGRKDPEGLYVFTNIPYATVPKGPHRYNAPLPPPAWLQPLPVSEKGIICPQASIPLINTDEKNMQEECLIANVYVPITEEKNLPVIVYVHGGAFELGYGDLLHPKKLVTGKNVIVVTFNYRLGVHGFLCLGTDDVPGNAGLKDQVALLKWVQKNIDSFGGNPREVTIAGFSAGAVSVDFLMLSKSAKGLFKRVIIESGVSVGSIATQTDPIENAKAYAKLLNFDDVDDFYALEKFYKTTPLESLMKSTFFSRKDGSLLFGPCVERKTGTEFISDYPLNIIKNGDYKKVPVLLGISSVEGLLFIHQFDEWKNKMNEKFSDFVPADLQFESDDQKEEVAKQIKEFYFSDKPVGDNTILSYLDYFSDILFAYSTVKAVKNYAANGHQELYLYDFSFVSNNTPVIPHTEVRGADHCSQTIMVLDGFDEANATEDVKNMSATMRALWYNFVVHGKPVPEGSSLPSWPSAGVDGTPHMVLDSTLELRGSLFEARVRFWEDIYQKYYRPPTAPPKPPHTELTTLSHRLSKYEITLLLSVNVKSCFFVALAAGELSTGKEEWLEVNIAQGPVRGRRDSTGELFVFHEIPFATAPTGENKFKAPLPPPTWTKTYDAIDEDVKTICHQSNFADGALFGKIKMDEQCLLTTIYVPDTKKKNLSVLVYVHGGAFQMGYGDWFKQKNLMKYNDVIVVNFNYRLGINGFLCLGTEGASGNAGLKDQVALLRWVQKNIAAFGGNTNDVTIAGYSAGSTSVDLLMVSKSAEGLIHKVIPESGSNIGGFATQMDPLQTAKDHAKTLNFTEVDDIDALEKFYTTLPIETLFADSFLDRVDSTFLFSACVERETSEEPFLTKSPENILKSGKYKKVPLLYGFANMEGLMRIDFFDQWKTRMNEKFSDFLPVDLKFESEDEKEAVAKQIKEFYFGDKPVDDENVLGYLNFFSDVLFAYSHLKAVKYHAQAGHDQVYLYEYDFVDEDTPVVPHTNVRGAYHCAQSIAESDGRNFTHLEEDDISKEFKKVKKILREIWHNFVTTGNPVPEGSSLPAWPPAGADRSPHMVLGQNIELRGVLLEERTCFWDSIYEKYYREPIPPPEPHRKSRNEL